MAPQDEVIIEAANADDYDTIYGDFGFDEVEDNMTDNKTMSSGESSNSNAEPGGAAQDVRTSPRPYIRLNGLLRDLDKIEDETARMKCEAIGSPLPIEFSWLKNGAPLEMDRKRKKRIRVKHRDYLSKLTITKLQVLDSGYYQCLATNMAGSVNTTAVLKVMSRPQSRKPSANRHNLDYPSRGLNDVGDDLGTLPLSPFDFGSDDWLMAASINGQSRRLKNNTCVPYGGNACAKYLNGLSILIRQPEMEYTLDIERNLIATNLFIAKHPTITENCKKISQKVGCFHRFHVCDPSTSGEQILTEESAFMQPTGRQIQSTPLSSQRRPAVIRMCKADCEHLRDELCPAEYAMAKSNNLIGDGVDDLLPECAALSNTECLPVTSDISIDALTPSAVEPTHFCYVPPGSTYKGQAHTTQSGEQCAPWITAANNNAQLSKHPISAVQHNMCRNPDNRQQPWCVGAITGTEQYCQLPKCPKGVFPHLAAREQEVKTTDFARMHTSPGLPSITPPSTDPSNLNPASGTNPNSNSKSSIVDWFKSLPDRVTSLPTNEQLALGGGLLAVLLLLICCLCCCCCHATKKRRRNKRLANQHRNKQMMLKNGNGVMDGNALNQQQFMDSAHLLNAGSNQSQSQQHYYRKLQPNGCGSAYSGSAVGHPNSNQIMSNSSGANMELNALLPPPPQSPPPPPQPFVSTIQAEHLSFLEPLGEGMFGQVWKGEMTLPQMGGTDHTKVLQVAIKTIKNESDPRICQDFDREIDFAASLQHKNIVGLLGVCYGSEPKCAVFEYMVHGDLHDFLVLRSPFQSDNNRVETNLDKERMTLDQEDFLNIATQISSGMQYLSSRHYVHRDLAARNCLLTDRMVVKISDFGLMRDVYAADYYLMQTRTMLPVRWMPPEAVVYGQFAESSDVWAFGTTLWEIYSYGAQPYAGYTNEQVIDLVRNRCLLECPQQCPPRMYSVMVECWHEQASNRPTFNTLHSRMQLWSQALTSPAQSQAYRPGSVNSASTSSAVNKHGQSQQQRASSRHSSSGTNNNATTQGNTQSSRPPPSTSNGVSRPPITQQSYVNMSTAQANNNCKLLMNNQSPLVTNGNAAAHTNGAKLTDSPRLGARQLQPLRATGYPDYSDEADSSEAD